MFKYYSYYNVGGYKDMFLGDSSMDVDKTYFLPLLPVWKKKAADGDTDLAAKVESLENVPQIKIVTKDERYGLPNSAKVLFSHGGYKVILNTSASGETTLAIRDIESSSKDESGRTIPFLIVIVGNTANERTMLEKVAAYASSHIDKFSKKISDLFSYDPEKNGLAFALSTLTSYLYKIAERSDNLLLTMQGEIAIDSNDFDVPLIVVPEGINKSLALQEQELTGKKVNAIEFSDVIPLDNQDKLIAILKGKNGRANTSIFSDKKVIYLLGGATILGFIIGFLIAK